MGERTGLKFSLSPFDSARFEALAEGLEVSVMQLSAWQADNDFHRLDSQFQRKSLLAAIGTVCAHGAIQLHDEQLEIIHPHELKREYTEEDAGTWFLRTQNVRPMRLDKANKVFLPTSVADGLPRNRVRADDILMTRTGANRGDCTLFDGSEPAVASSHVFLIRSAGWSPSYLMTFLNTKYGLGQIEKGAYGAAQPELAPYYLQRIWIPAASDRLQSEISRLIHEAREASSSTADQLAR